jgi:predicted HicB family RNase H-like nuclease
MGSASIRPVLCREPMRKTETLNLRVSTEFKRRLIKEAKMENRSVTNYLEVTLANLWKREASLKRESRKEKE